MDGGWFLADFEVEGYLVAFGEVFGFTDAGFEGEEVTAIFGPHGGGPAGTADLGIDMDHAPAISHGFQHGF